MRGEREGDRQTSRLVTARQRHKYRKAGRQLTFQILITNFSDALGFACAQNVRSAIHIRNLAPSAGAVSVATFVLTKKTIEKRGVQRPPRLLLLLWDNPPPQLFISPLSVWEKLAIVA